MNLPKANLHIHSTFSDGKGAIKQIIKRALNIGLKYIAITDHFTNSWKADIISTLNTRDKIIYYLNKIEKLQKQTKERNNELLILKGIEIDLTSSKEYIEALIKPDDFDLILFEYVETSKGIAFAKSIIESWKSKATVENFPILGLAHCDPGNFIYGSLDCFINFLKDYSIFFEFNSAYSEVYSRKNELFFKKIKEHNIPVSVGSDCHYLKSLGQINEPLEMISFYDLDNNYRRLIERINLLK
ncbi:MAG: PHP domain-containing protein [Promethearchaeota archaeon]